MPPSFSAFIDESGDEGFTFRAGEDRGSSRWLVLSAAAFRKSAELEQVRIVSDVQKSFKKTKPLHFVDLSHEQRVAYANAIAKAQARCISVLVQKTAIHDPEVFQHTKNQLYIYIIRYLLERLSWMCRDYRKAGDGDGTVEITFSHRRNMSYSDIQAYLEKLRSRQTEIDWDVINPAAIKSLPHEQRWGLQFADAVASSFAAGVESNRFGNTEGRYAEILRPIVWKSSRAGKFAGYGIKIWPFEAVLDPDRHRWLLDCYGIPIK